MTQSQCTVLVTGAGGPLGVNLTRSLKAAPVSLDIVGTDANRYHLPLSLCRTTYLIPPAKSKRAYRQALVKILEDESIDVVIPTHPVEVRAVAELVETDALKAKVVLPRASVLEVAADKAATQRVLADAGILVPRTIFLSDEAALCLAFQQLTTDDDRVWVRGSGVPGLGIGGAALPCRDLEIAKAWIAFHDGWGKMAASEYLPGANLSWMGVFDRGKLVAAGSRERLEYVLPHVSPSGITGAPAVSRTISRADVASTGERAVRAIDDRPNGAYFVDLKENRGGAALVTEINAGRCGTTIEAYTHAGYNFPWLLVRLARGESVAPLECPNAAVRPDLYWVRTLDCGPVLVQGDAGFDQYPKAGIDGP